MDGRDGTAVSFSVLIPALNEEKNIGGLLDDLYSQDLGGGLTLERVIVISDGSTDDTEAEVLRRAEAHESLELVVNDVRLGKAECINRGKRGVSSDFLVLIDGDVRLQGEDTLFELLRDLGPQVGMAGGIPVPVLDVKGLAPRIFVYGDILRDYIRRNLNSGSNIYSAHGRVLALSRDLYERVEIPRLDQGSRVLSTDQFLYYSCVKAGMAFALRPGARVLFKLPKSFKDYLLVSVRFMYSATNTTEFFDDRGLSSEFHVPLRIKVGAMINLIRLKPLGAVEWLGYRLAARTVYLYKRYIKREEMGAAWQISETTKDTIEKT